MKLIIKLLVYPSFLVLFSGCPMDDSQDPDSELLLYNNSKRTILFSTQYNVKGDTSLKNNFPILYNNTDRTVYPYSLKKIPGQSIRIFKEYPNDILMLYLFDRDTLAANTWDTIVAEYNLLKRYDLTLDSLERRGWKVNYP